MQKKLMLRAVSLVLSVLLCCPFVSLTAGANETETEKVNGAAAIMATASSQVGYYEGSGGYSKYGEYFGNPYVPWCGAFVSWCARTTGIPQDVIPTNLSSTAMRDYFKGLGLHHLSPAYGGTYIPKQGDIVFFTSTNSAYRSQSNITHVGLVLSANSSTVTCIEGNCPDRVRQLDRSYTSYITGFATPRYEGIELDAPASNVYKAGTYVTDELMNFRTTPGGAFICTIPAGTTLQITAVEGVWGKTEYNGETGWMSLQYSSYKPSGEPDEENPEGGTDTDPEPSENTPAPISPTGENQYRVTEEMRIRSEANKDSETLGFVPAGTLLQVTDVTEDNWGKITYNNISGWICLDWSVKFTPEVDWLIIDISQWQAPSDLDWAKLQKDGVKGVILRIGGRYPTGEKLIYDDDEFMTHYRNAKNAGMHVGVYFFSYALTKEEAIEEAQYTLDIIEKNNCVLDLPIYIDMEDLSGDTQHINAGKAVCTMVLDEFCKTIEDAGYYAGIYCSRTFAEDFAEDYVFEGRSTWIADWDKDVCCYNDNIDMWQYTENGKLSGSKGELDLNRLYVDYPSLINAENIQNGLLVTGDITMDGNINAADARLALRYSVGLDEPNSMQSRLADINNDGKVSSGDARDILKLSVS